MPQKQTAAVTTLLVLIVGSTILATLLWPRQVRQPQARRVYDPADEAPARDDQDVPSALHEMRPLGGNWKVDANGVIYDSGNPIGAWGVNGFGKDQLRRLETQSRSLFSK